MHEFVYAKLGVVNALADRPEKVFTIKTALLGVYGQIPSWVAEIVPDVLADVFPPSSSCIIEQQTHQVRSERMHPLLPVGSQ